jgi:hypothetical protein
MTSLEEILAYFTLVGKSDAQIWKGLYPPLSLLYR